MFEMFDVADESPAGSVRATAGCRVAWSSPLARAAAREPIMQCPSCKSKDNKVIDSRVTEGGATIRRRRVCTNCERRFTTKERLEEEFRLTVVKSSRQRVPYNRDNVLNGIARACTKLEITGTQIEELVNTVEGELVRRHDREVTSEEIGRYVGMYLRRVSPVAYVRFMSVHRKYDSVDAFIDEITDVRERVAQDSPNQQTLFDG